MGYYNKLKFIFIEEGFNNLINRGFRYFIYVLKRLVSVNEDMENGDQ